jgi:hypothetical protein
MELNNSNVRLSFFETTALQLSVSEIPANILPQQWDQVRSFVDEQIKQLEDTPPQPTYVEASYFGGVRGVTIDPIRDALKDKRIQRSRIEKMSLFVGAMRLEMFPVQED